VNAFRALLLVGLLVLAGCGPTSSEATSPPATAGAPASAPGFGGTDLAWVEINIAMDEQLVPLLDLVPDRSGSAGVQALATQVKAFTDAELSTLRQLHDQAGLPDGNPHEGMPMPGMVQAAQVEKAAKMVGPEFDQFFLTQVKGHLDQSQQLARSEDQSGVEAQTRSLALQVLRTRKEALSTLSEADAAKK
jgi:uncharacterized protein (DUF305 family)